jgi:hypothetical protein
MPDTGAPWNIPYAAPADLVRDWPALSEDVAEAIADGLSAASFSASTTITATNASWPVPALANPIVRVTVIGGGGAGGVQGAAGNDGGTTTFNAGGAGIVTAAGGLGGGFSTTFKGDGTAGLASGNGGQQGLGSSDGAGRNHKASGNGGAIAVAYLNLTGIGTVSVTIGAGGAAAGSDSGAAGGRGEVIVEYVAG